MLPVLTRGVWSTPFVPYVTPFVPLLKTCALLLQKLAEARAYQCDLAWIFSQWVPGQFPSKHLLA